MSGRWNWVLGKGTVSAFKPGVRNKYVGLLWSILQKCWVWGRLPWRFLTNAAPNLTNHLPYVRVWNGHAPVPCSRGEAGIGSNLSGRTCCFSKVLLAGLSWWMWVVHRLGSWMCEELGAREGQFGSGVLGRVGEGQMGLALSRTLSLPFRETAPGRRRLSLQYTREEKAIWGGKFKVSCWLLRALGFCCKTSGLTLGDKSKAELKDPPSPISNKQSCFYC